MAIAFGLLAALVLLPVELFQPGRVAVAVFGTAVILWASTKLDASWIAIAGAVALVLFGAADESDLTQMLADDIIWLMIGAFVIGAAFESSGLASRLTGAVAARARTTGGLFWLTTLALIPLTFLIPSTSGRAAATLPALNVFFGKDRGPEGERGRRAFAILIPTIILVATTAALTGAGSHLLAEDLLYQRVGERVGFARWALWGLPFALAASLASCWVVLRLFLNRDERAAALPQASLGQGSLKPAEWKTLVIAAATFALWFTTSWHGYRIASVAILAMIVLTAPRLGVMKFKAAMKAVNWSLVVFVGAALVLGQALINTQAAGWLVGSLFEITQLDTVRGSNAPAIVVVAAIALISLMSHLFMTSHVARMAALGPPFILMAQTAELNPVAVLFIATAGMNYCLTLPVCSKALLLFQDVDGVTFRPRDLLRLSAVLTPVHLVLMVVFYFGWWQPTGLSLTI
jgi:anion transporter